MCIRSSQYPATSKGHFKLISFVPGLGQSKAEPLPSMGEALSLVSSTAKQSKTKTNKQEPYPSAHLTLLVPRESLASCWSPVLSLSTCTVLPASPGSPSTHWSSLYFPNHPRGPRFIFGAIRLEVVNNKNVLAFSLGGQKMSSNGQQVGSSEGCEAGSAQGS